MSSGVMKRWGAALVVLLVVLAGAVAQAGTITIKYSDHDPPGGVRTNYVKNVWFPEMIKQTGNKITIVGVTQSDARVSTLMRAIDSSPWLDTPGLVEVHAVVGGSGGKERTNEFTLTFNLKKGADIAAAASAARAASAPVAASAPSAASAPATTSPAPAFVPAASTPALSGGSKKG